MKFIFGLKNLLTNTIQYQLRKFLRQKGKFPTQMIADRDFKLVGEEIEQLMQHTQISGAPSGRQSQNGLSEIRPRLQWRPRFSLFQDSSVQDMPPAYDLLQSVFLSPTHPDHPSAASTIINILFSHTSPYSVQITSTKDIVEVMVSDIVPHDPTTIPPDTTNLVLLHPWIQDNSKATLLIPSSMTKLNQGLSSINPTENGPSTQATLKKVNLPEIIQQNSNLYLTSSPTPLPSVPTTTLSKDGRTSQLSTDILKHAKRKILLFATLLT